MLVSCRTRRNEIPLQTRTTVKDRDVTVAATQDSASLRALFECDSNRRVVQRGYDELKSKGLGSSIQIVPQVDGKMSLTYRVKTNNQDTHVTAHDSIVYQDVPIYKDVTVEVERKLTWFQKTLIYTGAAAWIFLLLFIISRFYNPLKLIK